MVEISLTTFVDFAIKSGTSRITYIRKAKRLYEEDYQPAFDFWKPLRDAIIDMHKENKNKDVLNDVLIGLTDKNKVNLYPSRISAYKRWMGRKEFHWIGCEPDIWQSSGLLVRVNPELGLDINSTPYVIKLYFKEEKLSKHRVDTMIHLIQSTLPAGYTDATPAILDVARGRLLEPTRPIDDIEALLHGEAAALVAMWNRV